MTLGFAYEESKLRSKYLGGRGGVVHDRIYSYNSTLNWEHNNNNTTEHYHDPNIHPIRAYKSIKHSSTVKQILINAYYLKHIAQILPSKEVGLVVLWVSSIGVTIALASLISYHVYLIIHGQTTIEHYNSFSMEQRMK